MCIYHKFFIHSSVDGHLGCFHVLATVNSAAVNTGVHMTFSILVSSGYMRRSRITGSYGGFILGFLSNLHTIFLHQFTFLLAMQEGSLFSTPSAAFIAYRLFDDGHSDWCEVVCHCSFVFHFANNKQC